MLRKIYLTLLALTVSVSGWAQPLFSIDGKDVSAKEFRRECRDFVEETDTFGLYSLMLDYADYRLLVHDAKTKSYDTTTLFRNAMQYYGNRLMLEHVAKNPRSQALVAKLYQHSAYQYKVWAARVDIYSNSWRDTSVAYKKAQRLIERIANGRTFEEAAMQLSDSPQTKYDGGYLGWVSPIDFNVGSEALDYIFDHYKDNQISQPIRSGDSYYIIKVDGRRNAIADVDISPIIIRKVGRHAVNDSVRKLFETISQDIKSGKNFDELQQRYSDIKYSERMTLNAAYRKYSTKIADIPGVGKCSEVIETPNFFLIARLNAQTPLDADKHYRRTLDSRIWGTDIFNECYDNFLDSVRSVSGYQKTAKLDKICRLMPDSAIFEAKWNPDLGYGLDGELLKFDGKSHSLLEFAQYIRDNQYSTGYSKIIDYVSHRYDDYLDMLTMRAATALINGSSFYKNEMAYYSNMLYYEMHNPYKQFARNAADTAKVFGYYKDAKLSLKSSYVLNIRFFDYFSEQNRKKAAKAAQELSSNPQYAYSAAILKAGDAGTFSKGDNTLADRIIDDYDHGNHGKVFFFPENHTLAIVEIAKKPEDLPAEEVFPTVSPMYFNSQKENYIQQLRTKYHLEIKADARQILETIF